MKNMLVVYNCFLAESRQAKRRRRRDVMSHSVQLIKLVCGLLREAFLGEGSATLGEREGPNKALFCPTTLREKKQLYTTMLKGHALAMQI